VTFEGDARFAGVTFEGDAYFAGVTFEGDARFAGVTFEGDAYFSDGTFAREAFFPGSPANLQVRWAEVHLGEGVFDRASTLAFLPRHGRGQRKKSFLNATGFNAESPR
jgi:Pentapeptide repeats (9 copies)